MIFNHFCQQTELLKPANAISITGSFWDVVHILDSMNSTMSPGMQGVRSRMASRLTGNKVSSGWSDYHSSFMRLSADQCVDRERLTAAVLSLTEIDAFHKVGKVSKGFSRLSNNNCWISIFLQAVF